MCHISSGARPPKGGESHLEEMVLAAAAKQLNIDLSLGLLPMEAKGLCHCGQKNTFEERKPSPPRGFAGPSPISSQTHLLLLPKPASGKKCKVPGVTAELRGDCKSSLRKGGAPSPTPQRENGGWGGQSSLSIPARGEAAECQRVEKAACFPPSPQRGAALLLSGSFAAPGAAPQGCTPALSSANGTYSSQGHLILPPGHEALLRLQAGCFSSSRKAEECHKAPQGSAAPAVPSVHTGTRRGSLCSSISTLCHRIWCFCSGSGKPKAGFIYHQITAHKRSEELVSSRVLAGKAGLFSTQ